MLILVQIWLVGGAVADVAIAGVLSWTVRGSRLYVGAHGMILYLNFQLLYKRNMAARLNATQSVVGRIVRLVVETNTLTGVSIDSFSEHTR